MATVKEFRKAYTGTYWVTFVNDIVRAGCIECAPDEDPIAVAGAFGDVKSIDSLPYPARPVLRRHPAPPHGVQCPEFCYSPAQCKGRTACPKSYACSE